MEVPCLDEARHSFPRAIWYHVCFLQATRHRTIFSGHQKVLTVTAKSSLLIYYTHHNGFSSSPPGSTTTARSCYDICKNLTIQLGRRFCTDDSGTSATLGATIVPVSCFSPRSPKLKHLSSRHLHTLIKPFKMLQEIRTAGSAVGIPVLLNRIAHQNPKQHHCATSLHILWMYHRI